MHLHIIFKTKYNNNYFYFNEGGPNGIVTNMKHCNIVVTKFKLQLFYCIHFYTNTLGKDMTPPPLSTLAIYKILLLLYFYKKGLDI